MKNPFLPHWSLYVAFSLYRVPVCPRTCQSAITYLYEWLLFITTHIFVSSNRHLRLGSWYTPYPSLLHSPTPPPQKIATLFFQSLKPKPLDSFTFHNYQKFYCLSRIQLFPPVPPAPFSLLPIMVKVLSSLPGLLGYLLTRLLLSFFGPTICVLVYLQGRLML